MEELLLKLKTERSNPVKRGLRKTFWGREQSKAREGGKNLAFSRNQKKISIDKAQEYRIYLVIGHQSPDKVGYIKEFYSKYYSNVLS